MDITERDVLIEKFPEDIKFFLGIDYIKKYFNVADCQGILDGKYSCRVGGYIPSNSGGYGNHPAVFENKSLTLCKEFMAKSLVDEQTNNDLEWKKYQADYHYQTHYSYFARTFEIEFRAEWLSVPHFLIKKAAS